MSRSHGPAKSCVKMRCVVTFASPLLLVATTSFVRAHTRDSSTHSSERPRIVNYELKFQELNYVFGPLPPVLRVHPGDIVDTTTVDADGKALEEGSASKSSAPKPREACNIVPRTRFTTSRSFGERQGGTIGRNSTGYGCPVTKTAVVNPGTTRVPVWALNDDWPTIGSVEYC